MWNRWTVAGAGALALVVGALVVRVPLVHVLVPFTACLGLALVLGFWPRSRGWAAWGALAAGVSSLTVTVGSLLGAFGEVTSSEPAAGGAWILLEPAAILAFVYLAVRWSSPRIGLTCGGIAVLATAVAVQRYAPAEGLWVTVSASVLWVAPGVATGVVARYLRYLAGERERAVAMARREQRMDLASDLHDFVAHDVSEIVAQAQAAKMVLAGGDPRIEAVLTRIEGAGLRALASMDRTVHMLRDTAGAARAPVGVLADLPELVSRFSSGGVTVGLDVTSDAVAREPASVAYRIIVEALTNVRRHAGSVTTVDVAVAVERGDLRVSVTDDGAGESRSPGRTQAGLGLPGLAERVAALGGAFSAGPRSGGGWVLSASIPLEGAA